MVVDYNKIAKWFSASRKNMKWEELNYFFSEYLSDYKWKKVLDIWCWSGRLLEQFAHIIDIDEIEYLWVDLSDEMIAHAQKNHPWKKFKVLNMLDINNLEWEKFDYIFFIASFHHIENFHFREEVLEKTREVLNDGGVLFMTNWALDSKINHKRYSKDIIPDSDNEYGSLDYKIKFWDYYRFYHGFSLLELEYLFIHTWYEIIENREFDTGKNIISVIRKK